MKKRIMCFGDSNTWGAVPEDGSRYPEEIRWTGVLQRELGEAYQVVEEGYCGRTSVFEDPVEGRLSGVKYFAPCCDSQSPLDLIVLMLGTNDLKMRFGVSARTIAYGLGRYLDTIQITPMAGTKPKVLIAAPILIDPSYKNHALFHDMFGEYAVERSKELAGAMEEFAKDAGVEFFDSSLYGQASTVDGIHMPPDSHERLGKAMAEKVKEILG